MKTKFWIPVLIFFSLTLSLFYVALNKRPAADPTATYPKPKALLTRQISLPKELQLTSKLTWKANPKTEFVIVNFWATWCLPCIKEIPELEKLSKDSKLEVIGISMDKELSLIDAFVKKMKMSYPIGHYKLVQKHFGNVNSIPTTAIFNKQGTLIDLHIGLVTETELRNSLQQKFDQNDNS